MKKMAMVLLLGMGMILTAGCSKDPATATGETTDTVKIITHDTVTHDTVSTSGAMVWSLQPGISGVSNGPNGITSLASSGSAFVAVGDSGQIFSSADGVTWTKRATGTTWTLWNVLWGKNQFVAVGDSGTILTSPDGTTWTARSSWTTPSLYTAVWGANKYIAYGLNYTAATSSDGISWTVSTSNLESFGGYSRGTKGITWGSNKFVVTAMDSIYTSADGLNWTPSYPISPYPGGIAAVIWADSQFVVAGNQILTSPDGINWTVRGTWENSYLGSAYSIAWGNGKFVIGQDRNNYTSVNGITWNLEDGFPEALDLTYLIAYGAGKFVVVDQTGMVLTSP